jgi:hypothetical protein
MREVGAAEPVEHPLAQMAAAARARAAEAREATGMGWLHTRSTQTRPRKYRGR